MISGTSSNAVQETLAIRESIIRGFEYSWCAVPAGWVRASAAAAPSGAAPSTCLCGSKHRVLLGAGEGRAADSRAETRAGWA